MSPTPICSASRPEATYNKGYSPYPFYTTSKLIQDDPNIELLRQPNQRSNRPLIDQVVQTVRESGAITAANQEARDFVAQAQALLAELPANLHLTHLLALADYFVQRTF
jgi:geranylgeranyl pyrophosphate synthase